MTSNVTGHEDEEEVEEMAKQTEEQIVSESNWPRCSKCKRYMFMHDPGRGVNCEMSLLSKEELEVHDRKILLKRLEKAKEAQKKTSHDASVTAVEENSQPEPVAGGATNQSAASQEPPVTNTEQSGTAGYSGMFMHPMFMMNTPLMMNQQTRQIPHQDPNQLFMNPFLYNPMMMNSAMTGMMPTNMMVKTPVPEWNLEMSFEAWKRNLLIWTSESKMSPAQKLNQILESLKKNSERAELKIWIIQTIEEDTEFDRTEAECVTKLLNKMEDKFKVSTWKKAGETWKEVINFKQEDGESPKKYLERFNMLETKLKNINCKISNILLAQHFLLRAKLNPITIQNILAKVETESEEKVLKQVKNTFETLVNSFESTNVMNTTFYGDRHQERFRHRSKSESRRGNYREERRGRRDRTGSRSFGFRERGRVRSNVKSSFYPTEIF